MAKSAPEVRVKTEPPQVRSTCIQRWRPFETQRNQIDHRLRNFANELPQSPFK